MLLEFNDNNEYSIEYVPMQYNKTGLGARELLSEGYDVCLVYSSFAFNVIEKLGNEVVDINKSDMDRARALLKARQVSTDIGIPIQTKEHIDCALLEQLCHVRLHQIPFDNFAELRSGLRQAADQGVKVFIGGGVVYTFCQQYGMHCLPILPDRNSISEAIEKAVSVARLKRKEKAKTEQLVNIFKLFKEGVLYINDEKKITWLNAHAATLLNITGGSSSMDDIPAEVSCKLRRYFEDLGVDEVLMKGAPRIDHVITVNGKELVASTMPVSGHSDKQSVAVFLRDVNSVHDIAGKVRSIQRKQSGFIARFTVSQIKGRSPLMAQLRSRIRLYAPHDAPVLIHGETGTGKDLAAQALHNFSNRRSAPFVSINCAALPESLLESELFGYEEGAFTGAKKGGKPGLIEIAHTGTLFLDEMGELSQTTQLRLLRVLENKEIIRVGGDRVIPVNIRIISASHKSLPDLVRAGQFRADLFYRLAVLRLEIPPLRHRLEDVPLLIENQLIQHGRDLNCLTPSMLEAIQQYHWPGNIRELRSVIESYLIMLGKVPHDEPLFMSLFSSWTRDFIAQGIDISTLELTGDLKTILEETRRRVVMEAVARCGFNKKKAAQQLGISYNTLWRILGSVDAPGDPSISLADPNSFTMGIVDPAS